MIRIGMLGTGYVGLVTGACLADFGHRVVCSDIDTEKIERLKRGELPIYEPGLKELVERNREDRRLTFSADVVGTIRDSQVIFIAVGTPPARDGSADLSAVFEAGRLIARNAGDSYKVVIQKSTAPVGTARKLLKEIKKIAPHCQIDVASNPEFLREGSAIETFMRPDRIVIGTETDRAEKLMREIYRPLYLIETPMIATGLETAELIKYAANAFLATKISFINEIANLAEVLGANVTEVAKGIGLDGRIGRKFLHAGPGYGGSCFPKDTIALVRFGRSAGQPMRIVSATVEANRAQRSRMVSKIESAVGNLGGKRIALLGLSFKPNTDDVRDAPALEIASGLLRKGAVVVAHDPVSMDNVARLPIGKKLEFALDAYSAADGAHAVVIATEWNQYRRLDLKRLAKQLKKPILMDLRNVYDPRDAARAGLEYHGVGRPGIKKVKAVETAKAVKTVKTAKAVKTVKTAKAVKTAVPARSVTKKSKPARTKTSRSRPATKKKAVGVRKKQSNRKRGAVSGSKKPTGRSRTRRNVSGKGRR